MSGPAAEPTLDCGKTRHHLAWPDAIRVIATAVIFAYHFSADYTRLAGTGRSSTDLFIGAHFAAWGIAAFVVLAGFSLTYAYLRSPRRYRREYAARRLTRLWAPYWTVAVPFLAVGFAVGEATSADWWKVPFWLSGLSPISPETYLPMAQVWWYVSLALQISLLMPLIVLAYGRLGPIPTTVLALLVNVITLVVINAAGQKWGYLAQGLVLARLGEVMTGALAAGIVIARQQGRTSLGGNLVAQALLLSAMPLVYSMTRFTPVSTVITLGLVSTVCALLGGSAQRQVKWLAIFAAYTYVFYLSHAPVTKYTLEFLFGLGIDQFGVVLAIVVTVTFAVTWVLERVARRFSEPALRAALRHLLRLPPEGDLT